jgi:hypothetical protein
MKYKLKDILTGKISLIILLLFDLLLIACGECKSDGQIYPDDEIAISIDENNEGDDGNGDGDDDGGNGDWHREIDGKLVVKVTDFGATPNDNTDDTKAIQTAIDYLYIRGGGILEFPCDSSLIVTMLYIKEGIAYIGCNTTLFRPANQGKWTRTFTTGRNPYTGQKDSPPLIITGFIFDGNSANQGNYQNWELEHAAMIFLEGGENSVGRLKVIIEDCIFRNGVADAVSQWINTDLEMRNCTATNVFRGAYVCTGGNSVAVVENLTTSGDIDDTGIDIEVDMPGTNNSYKVDITLKNLELINGDFDIAVSDNSIVNITNVTSDAPFYLYAEDSEVNYNNCNFKIGACSGNLNIIRKPHRITFNDCTITTTRKLTGKNYNYFAIGDIQWEINNSNETGQRLTYNNCKFLVDDNMFSFDRVYGFAYENQTYPEDNRLILNNCTFGNGFDRQHYIINN